MIGRFAPTPSGRLHLGNLLCAMLAYLSARSQGGQFLLRIEDTDRTRFVPDAVDFINRTLDAAHIIPDEGPDIGGPGVGSRQCGGQEHRENDCLSDHGSPPGRHCMPGGEP